MYTDACFSMGFSFISKLTIVIHSHPALPPLTAHGFIIISIGLWSRVRTYLTPTPRNSTIR